MGQNWFLSHKFNSDLHAINYNSNLVKPDIHVLQIFSENLLEKVISKVYETSLKSSPGIKKNDDRR